MFLYPLIECWGFREYKTLIPLVRRDRQRSKDFTKMIWQEHSEAARELALDRVLHQQWKHSAEPGDKTHCPLLDYLSYKYSLKSSKGDSFNSQSRNHIFRSLGRRHPPGTRLSSLLPPSLQAERNYPGLCVLVPWTERGENDYYIKPEHIKFVCQTKTGSQIQFLYRACI